MLLVSITPRLAAVSQSVLCKQATFISEKSVICHKWNRFDKDVLRYHVTPESATGNPKIAFHTNDFNKQTESPVFSHNIRQAASV